ncbi:MAG: prepilin peptidase [Chloroflexi bacterium]|nr:prepilin peptidase [Chloroflexota bacterium]
MVEGLVFAVLGLVAAIGVNVLADRLPAELGLGGGWICPACRASLPVSRGVGLWREVSGATRCPGCQARLPVRHAVVEMSLLVLFVALWRLHGLTDDLAFDALYSVIFALIFVVDLEHRLVLNVVVLPAALVVIASALIRPAPVSVLISALIGGAVGFGLLCVFFFVYPQGLGAGDVKLAGLIGLMLGWPTVLPGLLLGFALAAVVSIGLLVTRRASFKSYIPYAPFLVVGAFLTLLFLIRR